MGNDAGLIGQVEAAATVTDEPVWELPLDARYRSELDSPVADLRNLDSIWCTVKRGARHARSDFLEEER